MIERLVAVIYFVAWCAAVLLLIADSYSGAPPGTHWPVLVAAVLIVAAGWAVRYILTGKVSFYGRPDN